MNKLLVALFLIVAVSANGMAAEFLSKLEIGQQCNNNYNYFEVSSFTVNPFPPKRGVSSTSVSTGKFTTAQTISSIRVDILLNGRSFYHENIPQSGSYAAGQTATFTYSQTFPSVAPSGNYVIQGGLVNSQQQQINCWEVTFTL